LLFSLILIICYMQSFCFIWISESFHLAKFRRHLGQRRKSTGEGNESTNICVMFSAPNSLWIFFFKWIKELTRYFVQLIPLTSKSYKMSLFSCNRHWKISLVSKFVFPTQEWIVVRWEWHETAWIPLITWFSIHLKPFIFYRLSPCVSFLLYSTEKPQFMTQMREEDHQHELKNYFVE